VTYEIKPQVKLEKLRVITKSADVDLGLDVYRIYRMQASSSDVCEAS